MKKAFAIVLGTLVALFALAACGAEEGSPPGQTPPEQGATDDPAAPDEQTDEEADMPDTIFLTIAGRKVAVALEENAATKALTELLKGGDITYTASGYGGFEKVGELGHSLPRSDSQMTAQAGDVILYSGDKIVLFYGSNSWSYTRIGRVRDISAEEWEALLTAADPITVRIGLGSP